MDRQRQRAGCRGCDPPAEWIHYIYAGGGAHWDVVGVRSDCGLRGAPDGIRMVGSAAILFPLWWAPRTKMGYHSGPWLGGLVELRVLPRGQENRSESASELA
jgi:hypothetical protein